MLVIFFGEGALTSVKSLSILLSSVAQMWGEGTARQDMSIPDLTCRMLFTIAMIEIVGGFVQLWRPEVVPRFHAHQPEETKKRITLMNSQL